MVVFVRVKVRNGVFGLVDDAPVYVGQDTLEEKVVIGGRVHNEEEGGGGGNEC